MTRQLRIRKRKIVATDIDKSRLRDQLMSIIKKQQRAKALMSEVDRESGILLKEMQGFKLMVIDCELGEGLVHTPQGKSCTIIDPMAFHEAVGEEDFYNCVKVAVTKAREVLSEKELQTIAEIKAPTKKEPVLKIEVYPPKDVWED